MRLPLALLPALLLSGFWSEGTTAFVAKLPTSRATGPFPPSFLSRLASLAQDLGLEDRFDRWRYLQKLLDEETEPSATNKLLYLVLEGYEKYPRPKFEATDATGSPERTNERMEKITSALTSLAEDGSFPLLSDPQEDAADLVARLEELLPDPVEEEDDNKGTWDTIMELHGRESVKINQQKPTLAWKARCLVARLIIYYDFLVLGIVDKPFENEHEHELAP